MIETIQEWDRKLLLELNGNNVEWLDFLMWHISGKWQWIPLYLILLYLLIKEYKKASWIVLLGVAVLITLADQISVQLFKEVFERYRPCHNLEIKELVNLVNNKCGGKFGFVSSHATNAFAMASFVGLMLKRVYKKIVPILLLWAAIVAYSRVYLGVHYPSDILGGALIGVGLGLLIYNVCTPLIGRYLKNA